MFVEKLIYPSNLKRKTFRIYFPYCKFSITWKYNKYITYLNYLRLILSPPAIQGSVAPEVEHKDLL